jgi:hypothetical protein
MRPGPHTETPKITNRHYEAISCARGRAMIASTRRGLSIQQAYTSHQHQAGRQYMILQAITRPARYGQPQCRPRPGHLGKGDAASLAGCTLQARTRRADCLAAVMARRCRAQFLLVACLRRCAVGIHRGCGGSGQRKANDTERGEDRQAAHAQRCRQVPQAPVHAPHALPRRPSRDDSIAWSPTSTRSQLLWLNCGSSAPNQALSRSSRRRILPTTVFGSSSRNSMRLGTL